MREVSSRYSFLGRPTSARSLMCPSRVLRRCLFCCGRKELFTDLMDDTSFASQDELLPCGGEDGGGDAQEGGRGSRAPEPEAPQVGRAMASLWFIVVHADDSGCSPLDPEVPDHRSAHSTPRQTSPAPGMPSGPRAGCRPPYLVCGWGSPVPFCLHNVLLDAEHLVPCARPTLAQIFCVCRC